MIKINSIIAVLVIKVMLGNLLLAEEFFPLSKGNKAAMSTIELFAFTQNLLGTNSKFRYQQLQGMSNPYAKLYEAHTSTLPKDWSNLSTTQISKLQQLSAKEERFKNCQNVLVTYVMLTTQFYNFSEGEGGMSKADLIKGEVNYFIGSSEDDIAKPYLLAINSAWRDRVPGTAGSGGARVDDVFNECLALPISYFIFEEDY